MLKLRSLSSTYEVCAHLNVDDIEMRTERREEGSL